MNNSVSLGLLAVSLLLTISIAASLSLDRDLEFYDAYLLSAPFIGAILATYALVIETRVKKYLMRFALIALPSILLPLLEIVLIRLDPSLKNLIVYGGFFAWVLLVGLAMVLTRDSRATDRHKG